MKKPFAAVALAGPIAALAVAVPALGAPATAAKSKPATVSVIDFLFIDDKLTVKQGTKVTWKWDGESLHNVTVKSGPQKFKSTTKQTGTFAKTLTKPGTYKIVCTLHASLGMKMTIIVKK